MKTESCTAAQKSLLYLPTWRGKQETSIKKENRLLHAEAADGDHCPSPHADPQKLFNLN
jgi:hypothetical protein